MQSQSPFQKCIAALQNCQGDLQSQAVDVIACSSDKRPANYTGQQSALAAQPPSLLVMRAKLVLDKHMERSSILQHSCDFENGTVSLYKLCMCVAVLQVCQGDPQSQAIDYSSTLL